MSEKRKDSKGRILRVGEVQRADGKYMYRYVDSSGNRKSVYSWKLVDTDKLPDGKRGMRSLRDMEKEINRDIDDGIRTMDASRTTLDDLFDEFLKIRQDLKPTTRFNYQRVYNAYIRNEIGYRVVKTIKYTDLQKLYMDMSKVRKLKKSTIQTTHSVVYQILENAVQDNLIRTNPASKALQSLKKIIDSNEDNKRHALTKEEQSEFIRYVYQDKKYARLGPLYTVLLGTGMRIGEALGLRWSDCDFERRMITVDHALIYRPVEIGGSSSYFLSEPKTKAGMRVIPMFDEVYDALLSMKDVYISPGAEPFEVDGSTGFIFLNSAGKVFLPGYINDMVRHITNSYNREEFFHATKENREPHYLPCFSAHILRHTFCTRMCENETNLKVIQDIMGHSSIKTTMDVYNEATESTKVESFKELEGKFTLK